MKQTMLKLDDFYPGRLLKNLRMIGKNASGDVRLIGKEGSKETFLLKRNHCNKNIEKLKTGGSLKGPFVVLRLIKKGCYQVALNNYDEELYRLIYSQGWDTVVDGGTIPWPKYWHTIFSPEFDVSQLNLSRFINRQRVELRMPWAVLPLYVSSFMSQIQEPSVLFPGNLLSANKTRHFEFSAYRSNTDISWPLTYSASLCINQTTVTPLRIYLHDFPDPLVCHYKIWKHLTDDPRVSDHPGSLKRLNTYTGLEVPEHLKDTVFKNCPAPRQKPSSRCNPGCPDEHFSNVNQQLAGNWNQTYMQHAVTFFEKCPTNKVKICMAHHHYAHIRKFSKLEFFEVVPCQNNTQKPSVVKLILDGYCYNWDEPGEIPTVHLHFVTFFVGKDDRKPFSAYGHLQNNSQNPSPLLVGTFSDLQKVT